jgi:hypothetical protein
MISRETFKWFVRGFALASFTLLAISGPAAGWAQGGGTNPNLESLVVEPLLGEPGPESIEEGPPLLDTELSNPEALAAPAEAAAGTPRSAGPEPEVMMGAIPLAADGDELSNQRVNSAAAEDVDPGPLLTWPEAEDMAARGYESPYVIEGADLRHDGGGTPDYFFDFSGGYMRGYGSECFMAPAYLPDGATVTWFYASLYDNSASNIDVELRRVDRLTGSTNILADLSTSGTSTAIQNLYTGTISYATVDYPNYAYYITTCLFDSSSRLYSIRIYYTE